MNAYVLVSLLVVLVSCTASYWLGFYTRTLVDKIRTLKADQAGLIPEPKPTVTMGDYTPPREVSETDSPVGLVDVKTPQRLEWENEIETEKQGKGL
jgi:hypothetical protein